MRSVDWGLVGVCASAVIALAGTGIAVWQTMLAKEAARVSSRAADASAVQALAAAEQANLLRRQIESDIGERDRRDAPVFALRVADSGEWGAWKRRRGGNREFVPIAKDNTPSVHEWVKRRVLVLSLQEGPTITARIALDGEPLAEAQLATGGPFDMAVGASEQVPLFTVHRREGSELTVVITSQEVGGRERAWTVCRSVSL